MKEEAALWNRFSVIYDAFVRKDVPAYREIIERAKTLVVPEMRVLEIATGTGTISLGIADSLKTVEAIDISPDMIKKAKKKAERKKIGNVTFGVYDACALPYAEDEFDIVIIANTLHIMPAPEKALTEILRVLKSDGYLIAPTFVHAQSTKAAILSHLMAITGFRAYHRWDINSYCGFLKENGFDIADKSIIKASFPIAYITARQSKPQSISSPQRDAFWIYHDLIASIIAALDAKDHFTADHSLRVSDMVEKICRYLGLAAHKAETIHIAAHVHDIGKIGVPDIILTKPGTLNDEEMTQIQQHPIIGAKILNKSNMLSELAQIVLYHHERWDGKGYPEGLKGISIPLGSRIIAVCDSIDAMVTDRHYRQAMSFADCREEIRKNSGAMYDPDIAETVLNKWDEIVTGTYKNIETA